MFQSGRGRAHRAYQFLESLPYFTPRQIEFDGNLRQRNLVAPQPDGERPQIGANHVIAIHCDGQPPECLAKAITNETPRDTQACGNLTLALAVCQSRLENLPQVWRHPLERLGKTPPVVSRPHGLDRRLRNRLVQRKEKILQSRLMRNPLTHEVNERFV